MNAREQAIENLRIKAAKDMVPKMGPDGGPLNPSPHITPKQKKKVKGDKTNIIDPMYDDMHSQRAKERSEMKQADALKNKIHNGRKKLMQDAMKRR